MKKFINILLAAAVTALAVVSCQKEEQVKPGTPDPEGCYGVYFPVQEATGSHTYDPDMDRSVTFTVARTNTSGAITVPFTVVSEDKDVFEFGDIEFADGQAETELEVTFDDIEEGKTCSFSIQLNDDNAYVSHYNSGAIALDFSVIVVKWEYILNPKTGEKALFEFTQDYWGETAWAYVKYYEVDGVRYCHTESTGQHVYKEPYEAPGFFGTADDLDTDGELYFNIYVNEKNAEGNLFVEVLPVPLYVNPNYPDTPVHIFDYYYYWTVYQDSLGNSQGITLSWLDFARKYQESYPMSYYDDNGGIYIYTRTYGMYGVGGWTKDAIDIVGVGEGFTRVDYSLEVDSEFPDKGVTPILFTVGADVAKVDYAIYEGSLNSVQIAARIDAIAAGEEENVVSVSEFMFDEDEQVYYAEFGVSPETTGEYTLVAVSFNKITEQFTESVAQDAQSLSFFHVAAADDEDYDVKVSAFTEDTPARYESLHNYDSFAYGVSGKDLKEVHIAFYTADEVQKYGTDAVLNDAKADLDGEYVVSEDVLAEINADGGFYTVATGMNAKTTYYLVVWATNGSKENYAIATYTTEALPYVWNNLGKGTITDGFFNGLFNGKADVTTSCDVYEEATTPGLYMVTGFQCAVVAAFFGITPEEMAPYENGNWRNAEVVIDATKPDAVVIEAQDYGILVNQNYGFFMIETEPTGTLKDGAITWPAEEMYVGMPVLGKWYYGNSDGTFKITLPSAVGGTPTIAPAAASNGQVKDEVLSSSATRYSRPVVKYEREVKSISVETKAVNYNREKKDKKQVGAFEASAVSFK